MPGAEAEPRVENDTDLTLGRPLLAPAGLDKQDPANMKWMEVAFPGFRPVLAMDFAERSPASADLQATPLDPVEFGAEGSARRAGPIRFMLKESGNYRQTSFRICVRRDALCESAAEQFSDCLLGFCWNPNGDFPARILTGQSRRSECAVYPLSSRHGVKFTTRSLGRE